MQSELERHVWFWRTRLPERKGQPCRVLARGAMNSVLVEFADGLRVVTSRYAVRRCVRAEVGEVAVTANVNAVDLPLGHAVEKLAAPLATEATRLTEPVAHWRSLARWSRCRRDGERTRPARR